MVRCNNCWWIGEEDNLALIDEGYIKKINEHSYYKGCPICRTDAYLMNIEIEKTKEIKKQKLDLANLIIAYETGELKPEHTLKLFAELIRTKQAWSLQDCYGRTAQGLIDTGYISKKGTILKQLGDI